MGIILSAITIVGGTILVSWQNSIKTSDKIENIQKVQDELSADLKEKASTKMVQGVKENLEKEITYKIDAVLENQKLMMQIVAPNAKFVIPDTTK